MLQLFWHKVTLQHALHLVSNLADVEAKACVVKGHTYPACFTGSVAVSWLVAREYAPTRAEAIDLGNQLLGRNYIQNVRIDLLLMVPCGVVAFASPSWVCMRTHVLVDSRWKMLRDSRTLRRCTAVPRSTSCV